MLTLFSLLYNLFIFSFGHSIETFSLAGYPVSGQRPQLDIQSRLHATFCMGGFFLSPFFFRWAFFPSGKSSLSPILFNFFHSEISSFLYFTFYFLPINKQSQNLSRLTTSQNENSCLKIIISV